MLNRTLSRRRFLALTAATSAVALGSSVVKHAQAALDPAGVLLLTREDFETLLGERVTLRAEDGTSLAARVVDVSDRSTTNHGVQVEQCSVLLRTGLPTGAALEQQHFDVEHDELPACRLFMVPVLHDARSIHYEIVLSRLAA